MNTNAVRDSAFARRAALIAAIAFAPAACGSKAGEVQATTPLGITLVEVVRELEYAQPEVLWLRPGDSDGRTLMTYDVDEPGRSKCVADCAKEFPPLAAAKDARAFGDWSIVKRNDGITQWAYQSQPLYTWSKEVVPGEVANNVGLAETANYKLAQIATEAGELQPPEGWHVARFAPAESMSLPDGVGVAMVYAVQAVALTDANGHTLYTFDGRISEDGVGCSEDGCDHRWQPVLAPALAKGVALGEFTVATRSDGSNQWHYRDQPLYTYFDDMLPGDALGVGIAERWEVAAISHNFRPAEVGVAVLDGYGAALTANGMTLYGGYPFEKRWGGRNLRDTFRNAYYKGKALGDAACAPDDKECHASWLPYIAPDDAQPSGFWEPIERSDGRKQWAYKGYAMYTYAGDDAPREYYGQATYDFEFEGDGYDYVRVALLQDIANGSMKRANTNGGVGIYWNIAKP